MELKNIRGLGEKNEKLLNQLGIFSVEDLLLYYPYRYDFLNPRKILEFDETKIQVINVFIESEPKVSFIRRNFNTLRFRAQIQNKLIQVSIFNRAFLKPNLTIGKEVTLIGKYKEKSNSFVANDIKIPALQVPKIIPIYHLSKGIKKQNFEKWLLESFRLSVSFSESLPSCFENLYHFIPKIKALQYLHFPPLIKKLIIGIKSKKPNLCLHLGQYLSVP